MLHISVSNIVQFRFRDVRASRFRDVRASHFYFKHCLVSVVLHQCKHV